MSKKQNPEPDEPKPATEEDVQSLVSKVTEITNMCDYHKTYLNHGCHGCHCHCNCHCNHWTQVTSPYWHNPWYYTITNTTGSNYSTGTIGNVTYI
jgi:hypothetical protein